MLMAELDSQTAAREEQATRIDGGGAAERDQQNRRHHGHGQNIHVRATHPDQQKDQRIGDEGGVFPKRLDGLSPARRDLAKRAVIRHQQAGGEGGEDAGEMEMLGQQERPPGGNGSESDFHQVIFRAAGEQQRQRTYHRSARHSADDSGGQQARGAERRGRGAAGESDDHGKSHGGGAVVEQRFGFHQQEQASASPGLPEGSYYRYRIRGGNEHSEHGATEPIPMSQIMHAGGGDGGRQGDAQGGEYQNHRQIAP